MGAAMCMVVVVAGAGPAAMVRVRTSTGQKQMQGKMKMPMMSEMGPQYLWADDVRIIDMAVNEYRVECMQGLNVRMQHRCTSRTPRATHARTCQGSHTLWLQGELQPQVTSHLSSIIAVMGAACCVATTI